MKNLIYLITFAVILVGVGLIIHGSKRMNNRPEFKKRSFDYDQEMNVLYLGFEAGSGVDIDTNMIIIAAGSANQLKFYSDGRVMHNDHLIDNDELTIALLKRTLVQIINYQQNQTNE